MNQILQTSLNNNKKIFNSIKMKKILNFQLYFSIAFVLIIGIFTIYNKAKLSQQEKYSKKLLNNYNITKLYSNSISDESLNFNQNIEDCNIIGIIEIAKINVNYPIFSAYSDDLLKTSPCRFYGPLPGKTGNLCIAGHNYNNEKFFSRISSLTINDEIIIYNNYNKKFSYYVYDVYEVRPDNLSPVYSYKDNQKDLTLITCNNFNNNRIIVKALCKN